MTSHESRVKELVFRGTVTSTARWQARQLRVLQFKRWSLNSTSCNVRAAAGAWKSSRLSSLLKLLTGFSIVSEASRSLNLLQMRTTVYKYESAGRW